GERRVIAATVEKLGVGALGATALRRSRIDGETIVGQHDPIMHLGARLTYETTAHVGQHAVGLPVIGMAPAAAPAGLDAQDVTVAHDIAVAEGAQCALVRPARVDDAAAGSGGMPSGDTPGRM